MMNFSQSPILVIWETTQSCDLACIHCRASALPARNPNELTTKQGYRLLDQVKEFGKTAKDATPALESNGFSANRAPLGPPEPLIVFTGGDPMKRPDIFDLIRYSVSIGLRTNISPSATPLLTNEGIDQFKACGISRMAISLDGPDAASHDGFRGVEGTFDRAIEALRHAQTIGLETQQQTTVTRHNMHRLGEIADIVEATGGKMWSLFFLVVTGRAHAEDDLTAEEYEKVFEFLYERSKTASFQIKTTEAMHYRRYVAQRRKAEGLKDRPGSGSFRSAGVSDGKGFVFVSHTGEICPSGFLTIPAGNVKQESLVDVYRNSRLFNLLRDVDQREGKCGYCEFRNLCGGSRARAYATTGDYLAEDPRCSYHPQRWNRREPRSRWSVAPSQCAKHTARVLNYW